jgi:hypothetical protein
MPGQQALSSPIAFPHAWHVPLTQVSPFMHWSPLFTQRFVCGSQHPPDWHLFSSDGQQVPPGAPQAPVSDGESTGASTSASAGASPAASPPPSPGPSVTTTSATASPAASIGASAPAPVSPPLPMSSPMLTSSPASACVESSPDSDIVRSFGLGASWPPWPVSDIVPSFCPPASSPVYGCSNAL